MSLISKRIEIRDSLIGLLGLGLNVGVSFYFLPHVGLFAGVTDNISFVQMYNKQYYTKGTVSDLACFFTIPLVYC